MKADGIASDTGPFAVVPEWVLDLEISDRALRLYTILSRYADQEGKAFPSRRTLATRLRCSVDSVDRAMKELSAEHLLMSVHRYEDDGTGTLRRQTSNEYALVRHPGRTGAAGSLGTDAAPPGRTGAAPGTRPTSEREPGELELAATAAYDPLKGVKINGRNAPWDELVKVTGADEKVEAGQIAKALKLIRSYVTPTLSPQAIGEPPTAEMMIAREISGRARLYRQRWPEMELTPTALAKHWARVLTAQPGRDLDSALEAAQRGIDATKEMP